MTHRLEGRHEPSSTDQLERLAAQIVASETGVLYCEYDIRGGEPGLADFTLHQRGGERIGLLEVTSVTDPKMNGTLHSLQKQLPRRLPESRFYWAITVSGPEISVRDMGALLPGVLAELEGSIFAKVEHHDSVYVDPPARGIASDGRLRGELRTLLVRLGVQAIAVMVDVEAELVGYIAVNTAMGSHLVEADAVTRAVNLELAKSDNQRKLRAASGGRAELFVWLDTPHVRMAAFHGLTGVAEEVNRPVGQPELPAGVTAVWTAPTPYNEETGHCWYSDGGPWQLRTWSVPGE